MGLIKAVTYLHNCGVAHSKIEASHVVLNLYPRSMYLRYRDYPDVQLINLSAARPIEQKKEAEDVRAVLRVLEEVTDEWSNVNPFNDMPIDIVDAQEEEDQHPVVTLMVSIKRMLSVDGPVVSSMDHIHTELGGIAEDLLRQGPHTLPRNMMMLIHADFVTGEELNCAVRNSAVLKFPTRNEEMRRIVDDVPVAISGAANAGMKTRRILVMRFTMRKREFLVAIGELGTGLDAEGETEWGTPAAHPDAVETEHADDEALRGNLVTYSQDIFMLDTEGQVDWGILSAHPDPRLDGMGIENVGDQTVWGNPATHPGVIGELNVEGEMDWGIIDWSFLSAHQDTHPEGIGTEYAEYETVRGTTGAHPDEVGELGADGEFTWRPIDWGAPGTHPDAPFADDGPSPGHADRGESVTGDEMTRGGSRRL